MKKFIIIALVIMIICNIGVRREVCVVTDNDFDVCYVTDHQGEEWGFYTDDGYPIGAEVIVKFRGERVVGVKPAF